jgi:hypothetical protein
MKTSSFSLNDDYAVAVDSKGLAPNYLKSLRVDGVSSFLQLMTASLRISSTVKVGSTSATYVSMGASSFSFSRKCRKSLMYSNIIMADIFHN